MILREFMMALYVLYAVAMYAVPVAVLWWTDRYHEQACQARNAQLIEEQREGPLPECQGVW